MKNKNIFTIPAILFSIALLSSACNKKDDTIAKVYVFDENKNAISGCEVILKAEPSTNSYGKTLIQPDTAITNVDGEAIFNFNELYELGQAGVAVLNIDANKDGLFGEGVIQILEEETSEATVYIK